MALMLSSVREFHNVMAKYTDFVIRDISQKYDIDYNELAAKYIAKCSRAVRQPKQQQQQLQNNNIDKNFTKSNLPNCKTNQNNL
jgi:SOS response regulatory protein OraA/RecX